MSMEYYASGCATCDDPNNSTPHREHDGTLTSPDEVEVPTGPDPDGTDQVPGRHPVTGSTVSQALREEAYEEFVRAATASGDVSRDHARRTWVRLELLGEAVMLASEAFERLEGRDPRALCARDAQILDAATTVAELLRQGLEYADPG